MLPTSCAKPLECAAKFREALEHCLLPPRGAEPTRREGEKPLIGPPPWFELQPILATDPGLVALVEQLGSPGGADEAEFVQGLAEHANSYREWVLQATFEPSRASDRKTNRAIIEIAAKFTEALQELNEADHLVLAEALSSVSGAPEEPADIPDAEEAAPELPSGPLWAEEVRLRLLDVAQLMRPCNVREGNQALHLLATEFAARLASMAFNATSNAGLYAARLSKHDAPEVIANDPVAALCNAVARLEDGAWRAEQDYKEQRGRATNGNLHEMVKRIDEFVHAYRGTYLRHTGGPDRSYTGRANARDDKFLVGFFELVYATVPHCVRERARNYYNAHAALDVLKERSAARERAIAEPSRAP